MDKHKLKLLALALLLTTYSVDASVAHLTINGKDHPSACKPEIDTVFGKMILDHPALIAVHNHRLIQRLKGIDQLGTTRYFQKLPAFSRYEHSIGVLYLLKKAGASLKEQIAGLTHDASHTVFSHVADKLFNREGYQDHIHEWHLKQSGIAKVLKPFGISIKDILPDQPQFKRLEQDLPAMCADRIQYNLNKAFVLGKISRDDMMKIVNDLHYDNGNWYFTDPALAKQFAKISLYFTEHLYGSPENAVIYTWSVNILKRAMALSLITEHDIHFGLDEEVLKKISDSNDPFIQSEIKKAENVSSHYKIVDATDKYDLHAKTKFRGIDPFVMIDGKLKRLTEMDAAYAEAYKAVQEFCKKGLYITFI